jgi:hypothetical protein
MFQAALRAVGVGLWLTVCSPSAWAQAAVVKRNVNLRDGPDTSFTILRLLLPGEELTLRTPERDVGYYSVRTADGAEGWVWANNIRVLAESTATSTVGPPEVFDGCGLEGNAQSANRRALNRLKNRVVAPTAAQVDGTITLAAILVPGDDRARWSTDQAADVTGYVVWDASVCQGRQGRLLLPERAEVQDEVRDARLQRQGEPRRRRHVADRLCAEGVDRHRRGEDRRAREEGGELKAHTTYPQGLSSRGLTGSVRLPCQRLPPELGGTIRQAASSCLSTEAGITKVAEKCYPSPERKVLPTTWTVHCAEPKKSVTTPMRLNMA